MKLLTRWGPAVVWMAVIFFFSTRQHVSVSQQYVVNFLFFKTLHVIEYGVLFALNWRATKKPVSAFILTVAFAATDEFHQLFVATREGTVRDVIIDGLGASLSWITIERLLPKLPGKPQKLVKRLLGIS